MREAGRALHPAKKRGKQREQLAALKQRIAEDTIVKSKVDKKLSARYDAVEAELKSSTVGLVTLNDRKAKQEAPVRARGRRQRRRSSGLSFTLDEGAAGPARGTSLGKNPDVDTSFLPTAPARRSTAGCGRSCGASGRPSASR